MKKVIKFSVILLLVCITLLLGIGSYVKLALPDIEVPGNIKVALTPERVANGKYIANHVAVCMDCHSTRDWSHFAGPLAGNFGGGGEKFGKELGFPGNFYAPNITPFALKDWTDGELFRAITSGVNKDGEALFPVMPYHNYGKLDREDIYDIIAYIRTLEPVKTEVPESEADFPVNLLINTMPEKPALTQRPSADDQLQYGKYLVTMAGCGDCHGKRDKGKIIPGTEFGGGMEFAQPAGIIRSANITKDLETGIGSWTLPMFVQSFRKYRDSSYQLPALTREDINSPMPWTMYAGMTDTDLEAIYMYLNSIKPITNKVVRFEKRKS